MTHGILPTNKRVLQLMADRATQGLSDHDERAFDAYFETHSGQDALALEIAAAAANVGFSSTVAVSMPSRLRQRIQDAAIAFLAEKQGDGSRRGR